MTLGIRLRTGAATAAVGIAAGALLVSPTTLPAAHADTPTVGTDITTKHWDGTAQLKRGTLDNLQPTAHASLRIRGAGGDTVSYTDPFGDGTAKEYEYGTWTSPVVETGYPVDESISSWNAETPTGTWVQVQFRGREADGRWTKWYVMGRWASGMDYDRGDIHRTSLDGQGDADGTVYTDTFSAKTGHEPVAYQTKVTLLRPVGSTATPTLQSVTTETNQYLPDSAYTGTSAFTIGHQIDLGVPGFAQDIHTGEYEEFGGGGEVWCSPTSTSMVQYFWGPKYQVPAADLADIDAPNGDPQVDYAAMHAWDYTYEGSGNWPFSAAYPHEFGLDTFVTRLRSLAEAEKFIEAGIPLVVSANWTLDEMPEAGYATDGHLLVIGGFTADGDPIIYDPATHSDTTVRNVYTRKNFEKVWQNGSDGVAYVIHPHDVKLPANLPGETPNW